jgi:hypothetical protein
MRRDILGHYRHGSTKNRNSVIKEAYCSVLDRKGTTSDGRRVYENRSLQKH